MIEFVSFWTVYPIAIVVGSIVHECGHWLAGAALRCEPRLVCLGFGRQVGQVRALGVHIVLRAVPVGGHVLLLPRGRDRRNVSAAVTAAGPAANVLAAAVALLAWFEWGGDNDAVALAAFAFVGGQVVILSFSLPPRLGKINGHPVHSDGYKLLAWARGRDEDLVAQAYAPIVARFAPEERPAMTRDFAEVLFYATRPDRDEPWGRQQAIEGLRAMLARDGLNPAERASTLKRLQLFLEQELAYLKRDEPPPPRGPWGPIIAEVPEDGVTG